MIVFVLGPLTAGLLAGFAVLAVAVAALLPLVARLWTGRCHLIEHRREYTGRMRITSGALVALIVIFVVISSRFRINAEDEYRSLYEEYRSLYESVAFDTPFISNVWDIHLDENTDTLIYVKEECSVEDPLPRFFLHLIPVDSNDIPPDRQPSIFDNRDFWFHELGLWLERDICVIKIDLPYDVSSISTGQFVEEDGQFINLWRAEAAIGRDQAG